MPTMRSLRVLSFVLASGGAIAQPNYNWFLATPKSSPTPHLKHHLVYDSTRRVVLLACGYDGNTPLADTWTYDGSDWRRVAAPSAFVARESAALAFDSIRSRGVLFGGLTVRGKELDETWEWDGARWVVMNLRQRPPARCAAAMASGVGGTTMLYGGNGRGRVLGDTWLWDGRDWRSVSSGSAVPALAQAAMYFDGGLGRLVMLGGLDARGRARAEAYVWAGSGWRRLVSHDLPKPAVVRAVYAWRRRSAMIDLDGLWQHANGRWQRLQPLHERRFRRRPAIAYDLARDAIVSFGGNPKRGEYYDSLTWEHRALRTGASFVPFAHGCGAGASAAEPLLTHVDRSLPRLGKTLRIRVLGDRFVGPYSLIFGGSKTRFGAFTLPLNLTFIRAPRCDLRVSVDALGPLAKTGQGRYEIGLPIPSSAMLVGRQLHVQALQLGFPILSNGATLTIGR